MIDNIEVFKQNSIRIKAAGKTIYIDPFEIDEEPHDADFVLITHDHYDHFDTGSIEKVSNESTTLIVPEKMEKKAKDVSKVVGKLVTVTPGMSANIEGLEMETVPAYNLLRPFQPKSAG